MKRNGQKCHICCSLSLCKRCQTYVLRVQIRMWNLQLPPVLLLTGALVSRAPNWTGWESGHPSRRGCLNLRRDSNSTNCGRDYPEDPKNYIEVFTGLALLYELTWRDVMYVLGQTLIPDLKSWILREATTFRDEWLEREAGERGNTK